MAHEVKSLTHVQKSCESRGRIVVSDRGELKRPVVVSSNVTWLNIPPHDPDVLVPMRMGHFIREANAMEHRV